MGRRGKLSAAAHLVGAARQPAVHHHLHREAGARDLRHVASELAQLRATGGGELIVLEGLSDAAARSLVEEQYGEPLSHERAARLIREAKGHPLFLRELVEQERAGVADAGGLTLDKALRARIERFDESTRTLLALAALAGKPYGTHVFAQAMNEPAPPRAALATLLGCGYLRRSGANALDIYHDRIARAALARLLPEQLTALARTLATALDVAQGGDDAECARLWDEAGDAERAMSAYQRAADGALAALQFTRAAHHYGRAIELLGEARDERRRGLLVRLGEALVSAGRSAEAAETYQRAAKGADGETAIRLRILAAEQTLQSGQAETGMAQVHALVSELGIPVPRTTKGALALIALEPGQGCAARLRPAQATRAGLAAHARAARCSLVARDSSRVARPARGPRADYASPAPRARLGRAKPRRARAGGGGVCAAVQDPSDRAINKLLVRARALATQHGDPALEAEVSYREGVVAAYSWELVRASQRLEQVLASVTERCPDQPWLTTNIRLALGSVWFNRGQHKGSPRRARGGSQKRAIEATGLR